MLGKHIPLTNKERCQRYYAKRQQLRLKAFLLRSSNVAAETELTEQSTVSGHLPSLNIELIEN